MKRKETKKKNTRNVCKYKPIVAVIRCEWSDLLTLYSVIVYISSFSPTTKLRIHGFSSSRKNVTSVHSVHTQFHSTIVIVPTTFYDLDNYLKHVYFCLCGFRLAPDCLAYPPASLIGNIHVCCVYRYRLQNGMVARREKLGRNEKYLKREHKHNSLRLIRLGQFPRSFPFAMQLSTEMHLDCRL